jgi:hypothetical protein
MPEKSQLMQIRSRFTRITETRGQGVRILERELITQKARHPQVNHNTDRTCSLEGMNSRTIANGTPTTRDIVLILHAVETIVLIAITRGMTVGIETIPPVKQNPIQVRDPMM